MKRVSLLLALVLVLCATVLVNGGQWHNWGHGLNNFRWVADEVLISPYTVPFLGVEWIFDTDEDVSTTITTDEENIYFDDFSGNIYSVAKENAHLNWKVNLTSLLGIPPNSFNYARTSPTFFEDNLILGSQQGAYVFSINKFTGSLNWATQLSTFPAACITQSPTVFDGKIYIGTSSQEETLAGEPGYVCCTFIGEFFRLDAVTGRIEWSTPMLPNNNDQPGGYSGAAIWGSSPSIDPIRRSVYIATGNNYNVPIEVQQCQAARDNSSDPATYPTCIIPANHQDSILSLDMDTGVIKWGVSLDGWDAWNIACGIPALGIPPLGNGNCVSTKPGQDWDFGQAPMYVPAVSVPEALLQPSPSPLPSAPLCSGLDTQLPHDRRLVDLVIAGQKSGALWALNADNGDIVWVNNVCPGGAFGGQMWGSATDLKNVYVACSNFNFVPYTVGGCSAQAGTTTVGGVYAAIRINDGRTNWETLDPAALQSGVTGEFGRGIAPVTVAGGLVYAASVDPQGSYYIMNAENGEILKTIQSGGSVVGGATVDNGHVYWGSGYAHSNFFPSRKVYNLALQFPRCSL